MELHPLAVPAGIASLSLLAVAGLIARSVSAGPLDPPAGTVNSTYKTLTEVEPRIAINAANTPGDADSLFRISQPGSYYLTANVTGVPGKSGIEIATSNGVTIDLMGFSMVGVAGSLDGITTSGVQGLITVRNGAVGGWGDDGIDLSPTNSGESHVIEKIVATGNFDRGINTGSLSAVRGCEALNTLGNAGAGISVGGNSIVERCAAYNNNGEGITAQTASVLLGCVSNVNALSGIVAGGRCTITDCAASSNGAFGVSAAFSCVVTGCTASANSASGFNAGHGGTFRGCNASSNGGHGFLATDACIFTACAAVDNSASGFVASQGSRLSECVALGNDSSGFSVQAAAVENCTARTNGGDGVKGNVACRILNNTCERNGQWVPDGAGIRVTASDSRIEGNTCLDNDLGIAIEATVNLVYGNTCRANAAGNYSIAAGNRVGTILVPPVSGAINGNGGAAGLGTTDPWANIAY